MKEIDLIDVILKLDNHDECQRFMMDLCTPQELRALKERWRVCQLLEDGSLSYRDIHQLTGASLTTIGRVARFLREDGNEGYKSILNKLKS